MKRKLISIDSNLLTQKEYNVMNIILEFLSTKYTNMEILRILETKRHELILSMYFLIQNVDDYSKLTKSYMENLWKKVNEVQVIDSMKLIPNYYDINESLFRLLKKEVNEFYKNNFTCLTVNMVSFYKDYRFLSKIRSVLKKINIYPEVEDKSLEANVIMYTLLYFITHKIQDRNYELPEDTVITIANISENDTISIILNTFIDNLKVTLKFSYRLENEEMFKYSEESLTIKDDFDEMSILSTENSIAIVNNRFDMAFYYNKEGLVITHQEISSEPLNQTNFEDCLFDFYLNLRDNHNEIKTTDSVKNAVRPVILDKIKNKSFDAELDNAFNLYETHPINFVLGMMKIYKNMLKFSSKIDTIINKYLEDYKPEEDMSSFLSWEI